MKLFILAAVFCGSFSLAAEPQTSNKDEIAHEQLIAGCCGQKNCKCGRRC